MAVLSSESQENLKFLSSKKKNGDIYNNIQRKKKSENFSSLKNNAEMVDFVSSFMFPISFIIFQVVYWIVYLNSKYLILMIN